MAYDETLAARIRDCLSDRDNVNEKRMFGGLAFMVDAHMCCGIVGGDLMLRVGPAAFDGVLKKAHVRPMDFTGKPSRGMVYVAPAAFRTDAKLSEWIGLGLAFIATLPRRV